jgi:lipopolysaccharide biosynthesis protein
MEKNKARVIAFYLPQFHPIPENDEWWGKGFTEWTNVGRAKPLFKNHDQPKVPSELGYYDLRVPETRIAQAELAKEAGIEGFCYWHYWFGNGKRLLERPFNEVLTSGQPDYPFCLAWANHSWENKTWQNDKNNKLLIEQTYNGIADYKAHFYTLINAFRDKRYILVDNKPVFYIWDPFNLPNCVEFIDLWRKLAIENGLKGIYFIGSCTKFENRDKILRLGFDAVNISRLYDYERLNTSKLERAITHRVFSKLKVFDYEKTLSYLVGAEERDIKCIPTLFPNWDNSPRAGKSGSIFINSSPKIFKKHVRQVLDIIKNKPNENRIVFLKSWNEWAEGNYMEPDLVYGRGYIDALKEELSSRESNK